nr:MAG TPA: hypothetical protein [Bacteriophage sp.]
MLPFIPLILSLALIEYSYLIFLSKLGMLVIFLKVLIVPKL